MNAQQDAQDEPGPPAHSACGGSGRRNPPGLPAIGRWMIGP